MEKMGAQGGLRKVMVSTKAGSPSIGNAIAGVWKLKSYSRRLLDTGEIRNDMLPHAYSLIRS